jgi:hypothetical protein
MNRLLISLTAAAGAGAIAASFASAAIAQQSSQTDDGTKIAEIIVYGNDPCPRSTDDAIVVCARKPETERYRIPERYRDSGPRQTRQSWAQKAKSFEYVGRTGIQSCSAVGPGGNTGCLQNMIDRAKAESQETDTQAVPPPENAPPGG